MQPLQPRQKAVQRGAKKTRANQIRQGATPSETPNTPRTTPQCAPRVKKKWRWGSRWKRLAVGGWRLVAIMAVGGWRLAVGGGWWWLAAVGGWWWRLAVVDGWRLVAAGGWRRLVAGGWWRLLVGGWWSLGGVLRGGPQQKKKNLVPKGSPCFIQSCSVPITSRHVCPTCGQRPWCEQSSMGPFPQLD